MVRPLLGREHVVVFIAKNSLIIVQRIPPVRRLHFGGETTLNVSTTNFYCYYIIILELA